MPIVWMYFHSATFRFTAAWTRAAVDSGPDGKMCVISVTVGTRTTFSWTTSRGAATPGGWSSATTAASSTATKTTWTSGSSRESKSECLTVRISPPFTVFLHFQQHLTMTSVHFQSPSPQWDSGKPSKQNKSYTGCSALKSNVQK